ncbi:MAG: hypothetical protein ACOCQV_02615 [Halolamina sp.]
MSDKQFTFLQLHFHDGVQLGPKRLGSGDDGTVSDTEATTSESEPASTTEESGDSGSSLLVPALGFGALAAAVAFALKKLLAGVDGEGLEALDDIDEPEESVPIEITSPDDDDTGVAGLLVAALVGLLLVLGVAAKKLLSGSEEIVVEE